MIDTLFAGLMWQTCLVYLDEVAVFETNFEDHLRRRRPHAVLEAINLFALTLKLEKFRFAYEGLLFSRHVISNSGVPAALRQAGSVQIP